MVNLSNKQIAGVVSLIMILSGAVVVTSVTETYYCLEEDSVKQCVRLSSTNRTCYWIDADERNTRDLCSSGGQWKPITEYVQFPITPDRTKFQNLEVTRPIIMTNAEVFRSIDGVSHIQGWCTSSIEGLS